MKCKKDYRDMDKYAAYKRRHQAKLRAKQGAFAYERRSWDDWEIERVMEQSVPDAQLSVEIRRSVSAIQKMRSRQRKEMEL